MMNRIKIAVVGLKAGRLRRALRRAGFEVIKKSAKKSVKLSKNEPKDSAESGPAKIKPEVVPEIVVSYGGDGTSLYAEQLYPSVPRVLLRHSKICNKCSNHNFADIVNALRNQRYVVKDFLKVEGFIAGGISKEKSKKGKNENKNEKLNKLVGLNEIVVHNKPPHAIRLDVWINGKPFYENVIADGVVVATPHGSTGYFQAITRKNFAKGIGIAMNNPVKPALPAILNENAVIKVKISRGPGMVFSDNKRRGLQIRTGDIVLIRKHSRKARIIVPTINTVKIVRGFVQVHN